MMRALWFFLALLIPLSQAGAATYRACPKGVNTGTTDGTSIANCFDGTQDATGVSAGDVVKLCTTGTQIFGGASYVDPQFIGGPTPSTADGFQLKPTSPLIGAGTYIGKIYDFTGRRVTAPANIGAFGQHMAASRRVAPLQ